MKRIFRPTAFICLATLGLFASQGFAQEKLTGRALYEKLLREGRELIPYEGLSGLTWTSDGKAHVVLEDHSFKRVDLLTGDTSTLFDEARLLAAVNAVTGRDERALFFEEFQYLDGGEKVFFTGLNRAFIYELETGRIVAYEPERTIVGVRGRTYADVLSPNLKFRAYTRDYNLYVKDMDGNERALTTDGHEDLRNGFPDWVYPEELGQYEAFWWSPDSRRIAFMQFDERPVTKYPIVHDVEPIPRLELLGYPKPGGNNPIVRFFVVDVGSGEIVEIDTGDDLDVYLYRGQWTRSGREFTYHRLNRWQNRIEIFAADPATGKSRLLLRDEDPCYVEAQTDLIFLEDDDRFLWTSERSGWKEIYVYDMTGKLLRQLTDAKLPIRGIVGVDESRGWIYFTGAEANGTETHLYKVRINGTGFTKLSKEPGTHRVRFSPGFEYYTDSWSSFDSPPKTVLHRFDGTEVRVLGRSVTGRDFEALKLLEPERLTFRSADGKYSLDGLLYFPAHFTPKTKYPLILSIYGGPGSKGVSNTWRMTDSRQALAQLGFLVAVCDYRGVSGRGKDFQNLHYMKLGQVELEDHVAFVEALGQRPYVDTGRVGVTGHSYGGYFTCLALLKEPDVFHVGVAGAPVTDWRNYDTIYTERYMRRPKDNPDGYEKGSCLTYVKNLKGKLFIHHGAVDDNVHPGNTIQLAQALLRENKAFELMIYPESQHGIRYSRYPESRVEHFVEHLKPVVK